METPKDLAGTATEKIMCLFSQFSEDPPVVVLSVNQYNRIYSHVYETIKRIIHEYEKKGK